MPSTVDHTARRTALQRALAEITQRQDRLIATLETHEDPTGAIFDRVRERLEALQAERTTKLAALDNLDHAEQPATDPDLLDALPQASIDWAQVPAEVQRDLFDALQLQIRYDRTTNTAHGQVTLIRDTSDRIPAAITAGTNKKGSSDSGGVWSLDDDRAEDAPVRTVRKTV